MLPLQNVASKYVRATAPAARAAVAARDGVVGAAVRRHDVHAMDVDAAPQVAERRGLARNTSTNACASAWYLAISVAAIAVAQDHDVVAMRHPARDRRSSACRDTDPSLALIAHALRLRNATRRYHGAPSRRAAARRRRRRRLGAARAWRRGGRLHPAQRVDVGAEQRPRHQPGLRRIGGTVELEGSSIGDVGNAAP